MSSVTLITKATRLCNLRCAYCSDWRAGPGNTMSFEVLARTIARGLEDESHEIVNFVWHGGEPTVLPIDFFRRALAVQARLQRPGQRVHNTIQTNGTRLTPEWARFIRANEFRVGVSLDGPAEIHDVQRRFANGKPSYQEVLAGIGVLRDHGISFGVLMVVDEPVLRLGAVRIADAVEELEVKSFGLLAASPPNQPGGTPATPALHYVDPRRMARFTMDVEAELRRRGSVASIRDVESIRAQIHGEPSRVCMFQGGCLGNHFLVEPNGDVAHCDLFQPDPDYRLGNVVTDSFAVMRDSPAMRRLRERREREIDAMRSCPEFGVCNGWCPHQQYVGRRHDPGWHGGCCGLRPMIEGVRAADGVRRRIPVTVV